MAKRYSAEAPLDVIAGDIIADARRAIDSMIAEDLIEECLDVLLSCVTMTLESHKSPFLETLP